MQRTIKRETTRARSPISVPLLRQHTDRPNNSRSLFVQLFTLRTGIPSLVHIRTMPLSLVCVRVAVSSHISRSIRARIYAGQARMHSKRMRVQTRGCPCVSFVYTHMHTVGTYARREEVALKGRLAIAISMAIAREKSLIACAREKEAK